MNDLTVVIPSYNERSSILTRISNELREMGAEVIVVDDGSKRPHKESFKHGVTFGYGAAILTGIAQASRPFVMTMDGDGQHSSKEAKRLYEAFKLIGNADMVIGVRKMDHESFIRYIGRKFLNFVAWMVCMTYLPDLNSGMRIFNKEIVWGYRSILCKSFSFTTSLTISMLTDKYIVETFPIKVGSRKFGKTRVNLIRHGFVTLYYIFRNGLALRTRGIRNILRKIPLWNFLTRKGWRRLP